METEAEAKANEMVPHSCVYVIATDDSLHFVHGCSHRHHLASNFNSHELCTNEAAIKSVCGRGSMVYTHAYSTMKHTVDVAVYRGLPVGQMEPQYLFNENFVESYPRN